LCTQEREETLSMQVMEGKHEQKQRGRKRKWNKMKPDVLKDVGSGIPCLVHDKAFTRCLPMGCYHCENNRGLHCGDKDDDTGNAQLCASYCNDGQCLMLESSPCCLGVPPVPHLDVCELVKDAVKVVDAIGDDGDKTTVHDKALVGCLADGCHCCGTGFLPFVNQGDVPSNAQLC